MTGPLGDNQITPDDNGIPFSGCALKLQNIPVQELTVILDSVAVQQTMQNINFSRIVCLFVKFYLSQYCSVLHLCNFSFMFCEFERKCLIFYFW
jgi:hypothetical protein